MRLSRPGSHQRPGQSTVPRRAGLSPLSLLLLSLLLPSRSFPLSRSFSLHLPPPHPQFPGTPPGLPRKSPGAGPGTPPPVKQHTSVRPASEVASTSACRYVNHPGDVQCPVAASYAEMTRSVCNLTASRGVSPRLASDMGLFLTPRVRHVSRGWPPLLIGRTPMNSDHSADLYIFCSIASPSHGPRKAHVPRPRRTRRRVRSFGPAVLGPGTLRLTRRASTIAR